MENHTTLDEANFLQELNVAIKTRLKYESLDFILAQSLFWISILASFISAILIANKNEELNPLIMAIIAGIPGLVVVIQKTFNFTERTTWDTNFRIELQALKDKIIFEKMPIKVAADKFRELNRKFETEFRKIGFFAKSE